MNFFKTEKTEQGLYTMFIKRKGEPALKKKEVQYEMEETQDEFGETVVTVKKDALGQPIIKKNKVDMLNVIKNYPEGEAPANWSDREQYTFFRNYKKDEIADWIARNDNKETIGELIGVEENGLFFLEGVFNGKMVQFKLDFDSTAVQGYEKPEEGNEPF